METVLMAFVVGMLAGVGIVSGWGRVVTLALIPVWLWVLSVKFGWI